MNSDSKNTIQICDLVIELNHNLIKSNTCEKQATLSPSECLILKHLIANEPQIISREFLLENCWPGKVVTGSSLNVAIKNIRTALEELGSKCKVSTAPKEGYSFKAIEEPLPNGIRSENNKNSDVIVIEVTPSAKPSMLPSQFYEYSPLLAGMAVSLLIMSVFYHLAFFMERTTFKGINLYHDRMDISPILSRQLERVLDADTNVIYLHQTGIGCRQIQAIILNNNQWVDVIDRLGIVSCEEFKTDES